ncbi:MAG: TonB-dependent receptor plug domain-containing protein [Verrucomicrobia bacterium]|nr:TonB-dependent receptor plug domain-containing protein [Verrucomicrobiota bacterium]MDA1068891.1 TonB-dependent receptor plug domain-containing protein [Verrucomicrobiota bacterium]
MNSNKRCKTGIHTLHVAVLAGLIFCLLPSAFAQETNEDKETYELSPFQVDESADSGYYASQTLAGGRLKTNLSDVASSVQVVTQELLQDLGASSLDEVLIYTTNTDVWGQQSNYQGATASLDRELTSEETRENPYNANRIRGLSAATRTANYFVSDIPFDSYISGRIDINRGSNSFLFGLGSPGGIINSQLEQAEFRDEARVDVRFSTENFENNYSQRGSVNVNREIIEGKFALRVAAMTEDKEFTQRPAYMDQDRYYIAAKLKPWEDHNITLRAHYETGNIDSVPVDRLSPLENLTPFLTKLNGVEYNTPTGRQSLDIWQNVLDVATVHKNGARGLDAFGNNVPAFGNPSGGPVGNKWVMVYDDTMTADGLPGRAFQNSLVNKFWKGSPVLDPDNNYAGGRFLRFIGVPSIAQLQNVRPDLTNYTDHALLDYEAFDWRKNLTSGTLDFFENEFEQHNVTLEAISEDANFGIELSYDKQDYERNSFVAMGSPRITLDVNESLPVGPNSLFGEKNPNYGRPMTLTGVPQADNPRNIRETWRATAYAKYDFKEHFDDGILSWLGRHTVSGLYDDHEHNERIERYVLIGEGGDIAFHLNDYSGITNNRREQALFYLGPQQLDAFSDPNFQLSDFVINPVPSNARYADLPPDLSIPVAFWNVGDPTTGEKWDAIRGDEFTDIGTFGPTWQGRNGELQRTTIESKAAIIQSSWLNDLLLSNLGWRNDKITQWVNASPPLDDENVPLLNDPGWNLEGVEPDKVDNSIFSYGLVLKVPKQWLPEGTSVSLHYGDSENFQSNPGGYDFDGNLVESPSGKTTDYGITLSLADNKFVARLNYYEGNVQNELFAPSRTAYRWTGTNGIVFNVRDTFIELDKRDRNRDGIIDFETLDDGTTFDPDMDDNGLLDEFEGDGNVYPTLSEVLLLEERYREILTPFAEKTADLKLVSGADSPTGNPVTSNSVGLWNVLTDTADLSAEGYEFELTYNPTPSFRLAANITQQRAQRSNIMPRYTKLWDQILAIFDDHPNLLGIRTGANKMGLPKQTNIFAGNTVYGQITTGRAAGQSYLFSKAAEGTDNSEVREWRYNVMGNYSFSEGRMKGVNVGGAFRWQDEAAIGYALTVSPLNNIPFPDPFKPYYDDGFNAFDAWIGYKLKIWDDRIDWRIQLNVRNLFATKTPDVVQVQPDGSPVRVSLPSPREFLLSSTFSF